MAFTSGPTYLNVFDFGVTGDGTTDDTVNIQRAINAAYTIRSSGAQNTVVVVFPPAAYYCTGHLVLNQAGTGGSSPAVPVVLSGASRGPYNIAGATNYSIPKFILDPPVTTTTPFIQIGDGSGPSQPAFTQNVSIEDLHFHYKANENSSNPPIIINSPTINIVNATDIAVRRCSSDNTNIFISTGNDPVTGNYWNVGRLIFEELYMSTFTAGIRLDYAMDTVRISKIHHWPFYGPSDNQYTEYAFNNCAALDCRRADNVFVDDLFAIYCLSAIMMEDSPDASISPRASNGQAVNIGADGCKIGIWAISTATIAGWHVSNYAVNGGPLGSLQSEWAAFSGFLGTTGFLQIVGGDLSGSFTSSATMQPYSTMGVSTSFTGPFNANAPATLDAMHIRNYD